MDKKKRIIAKVVVGIICVSMVVTTVIWSMQLWV